MLTNTVRDIQSDKDLADVKPGMSTHRLPWRRLLWCCTDLYRCRSAGELLLVVFPGDRSLLQPVKVRPTCNTSLHSRGGWSSVARARLVCSLSC